MNIGLFGGTFNPLHNGHIETIQYVAGNFALNKVFFIPCAIPPHKGQQNLAPANDRLDIINMGLKQIPSSYDFLSSDIELKRKGPSFTIDTVKEFKARNKKSNTFLILGSDAFFDIHTWKDFKAIFNQICVIIMLRKTKVEPGELIEKLKYYIKNNISTKYKLSTEKDTFIHAERKNIFYAHVPQINISSTMIRKLIKQGDSISHMTPALAAKQIHDKGLYL